MNISRFFIVTSILLLVPLNGSLFAAMSSTNYQINHDTIKSGGSDRETSSSYKLRSTVNHGSHAHATSASYDIRDNYRSAIFDRITTFVVFVQNNSSQVAATALSGSTVTVSSATGLAVNDKIVIVQDEGEHQEVAYGQVNSVTGSDVELDFLTTDGSTLSIDGSSDYVYELNGSALALGTLSDSTVATAVIAWEVAIDVPDGYDVFVVEDHDLALTTDSSTIIGDVSDGQVSSGNKEYGGRSSDTSLDSSTFDTEDTQFTSSFQQVADRSAALFRQRDFLTVKAAISSDTSSGDYSHTLTLIYAGDY